jgi:pyridoxamine 5'-phosphate oxidase
MDCELDPDPFKQFNSWFKTASAGSATADVMALATATRKGIPSVRYVLFKGILRGGFSFFTHYASRKAREIAENPAAAVVFYWHRLQKQVRVEGKIVKLGSRESQEYFCSRPREKQIGAWASPQSQPLADRRELEEQIRQIEANFKGKKIPCPPFWGGYTLVPNSIEFWMGRKFRWHDRFVYRRKKHSWAITRLAP